MLGDTINTLHQVTALQRALSLNANAHDRSPGGSPHTGGGAAKHAAGNTGVSEVSAGASGGAASKPAGALDQVGPRAAGAFDVAGKGAAGNAPALTRGSSQAAGKGARKVGNALGGSWGTSRCGAKAPVLLTDVAATSEMVSPGKGASGKAPGAQSVGNAPGGSSGNSEDGAKGAQNVGNAPSLTDYLYYPSAESLEPGLQA
ncbi:hypothetical protein T484DRAFT_1844995 [Baffinella frigidus]|nr:hypothetical protein T484DRAFT_1844995 [Cryptophyta sp. CCMP2293]